MHFFNCGIYEGGGRRGEVEEEEEGIEKQREHSRDAALAKLVAAKTMRSREVQFRNRKTLRGENFLSEMRECG